MIPLLIGILRILVMGRLQLYVPPDSDGGELILLRDKPFAYMEICFLIDVTHMCICADPADQAKLCNARYEDNRV